MTRKPEKSTKADDTEKAWATHRRLVRLGQALLLAGAVVAITHWLLHLEAFGPGQPALWLDFYVGYPMAAVLAIIGAIVAGRKRPTSRPTP